LSVHGSAAIPPRDISLHASTVNGKNLQTGKGDQDRLTTGANGPWQNPQRAFLSQSPIFRVTARPSSQTKKET
jgi:hypothetical protein